MTDEEKKAKKREYDRAYNAKNKERRQANAKAWRENNLERTRVQEKAWRDKNRDHVRARVKKWHADNPDKVKDGQLRRAYGITLAQRDEMLERQGGACAICRKDHPQTERDWHVDHDHSTGDVRGILCHRCNSMLGHAQDNITHLLSAADYLRHHHTIH